jgi:hypothetical protein
MFPSTFLRYLNWPLTDWLAFLFIALYVMGKSPETRFNYLCLGPPNSRFMNMDIQSPVVNPVQVIKKRNNKCCFHGCLSRGTSLCYSIPWHLSDIRDKWITAIGESGTRASLITRNSRVCYKHFPAERSQKPAHLQQFSYKQLYKRKHFIFQAKV